MLARACCAMLESAAFVNLCVRFAPGSLLISLFVTLVVCLLHVVMVAMTRSSLQVRRGLISPRGLGEVPIAMYLL